MSVYFCLLLFIYLTYFATRLMVKDKVKGNNTYLVIVFIALYLFCSLRDFSVGRDIPGYKEIYDYAGSNDWFDATWTYMEPGYVFLMKLCNSIGLSFRGFFFLIYAIMLYPIYKAIKLYSREPLLSVIIFVCFQYLVFNMTGLRQGISTSICLFALPYAIRQKKVDLIKFFALAALAMSMHMAAIVFFAIPFILRMKLSLRNILISIMLMAILPAFRTILLGYIHSNEMGGYEYQESATLGMYMVFLFLITIFVIYGTQHLKQLSPTVDNASQSLTMENFSLLLLFSIVLSFFFNGTTLLRATMLYTMFMIFAVPNAFSVYSKETRLVFNLVFHLLMIYMLFYGELIPNNFDVVNYKLGSDIFNAPLL